MHSIFYLYLVHMFHIIEVKEFSKYDSTNENRQITLFIYMMILPSFHYLIWHEMSSIYEQKRSNGSYITDHIKQCKVKITWLWNYCTTFTLQNIYFYSTLLSHKFWLHVKPKQYNSLSFRFGEIWFFLNHLLSKRKVTQNNTMVHRCHSLVHISILFPVFLG